MVVLDRKWAGRVGGMMMVVLFFSGCASGVEWAKKIWGSSTQTLERERERAVRRVFQCHWRACFEQVVAMTQAKETPPVARAGSAYGRPEPALPSTVTGPGERDELFDDEESPSAEASGPSLNLFIQDENKRLLVVYGVPGAIDTTEVGIFFEPLGKDKTRLEFSSLSSIAKIKAAEMVTEELKQLFTELSAQGGS